MIPSSIAPREPRLVVFSGAGLSAESGLATFRGENGLWEGVPLDQVCNIATWKQNFEAVHAFYDARRQAVAAAQPNLAHRTIADWQRRWPEQVTVLTQNIDRLLEDAGCVGVVHLHGDARLLHCVACDLEWEIEEPIWDRSGCPVCHRKKTVKPGVVFFGQAAPAYEILFALARDLRPEDTAIVVGTSGAVLPADRLFGHGQAHSVLVNLVAGSEMDESAFSERHYGPATRILPTLTDRISARMDGPGRP